MARRWEPSKAAKRKFAQKMNGIDQFCTDNKISSSASSDSYYFAIDEQCYRVSNHIDGRSNRVS